MREEGRGKRVEGRGNKYTKSLLVSLYERETQMVASAKERGQGVTDCFAYGSQ